MYIDSDVHRGQLHNLYISVYRLHVWIAYANHTYQYDKIDPLKWKGRTKFN